MQILVIDLNELPLPIPRWSVGKATIVSTYSAHRQPGMTASIKADILLEIGLSHYNVTYWFE